MAPLPHRTFKSLTPGMLLRVLADVGLLVAAQVAAYATVMFGLIILKYEASEQTLDNLFGHYLMALFNTVWPLTTVCILLFLLNGFYTYGRFYQGRYKALVVTQAVSVGYLLYGFFSYMFNGILVNEIVSLPGVRMVLGLSWVYSIVLTVGARIFNELWQKTVAPERATWERNLESRRVLVIGGGGYIGSALLPKLLDSGYQVRLLDMLLFGDSAISKVANHPNLEIVREDFRDVQKVLECMRGVGSVIHLGAIVGDPACSLDESLTIDVNLSATRMIAELARDQGIERFIFASTCSVYGACDETLDERSEVKPISLYGHTKLASERVLQNLVTDEFRPSIVRFATIYGLSGRTRFDLVVNVLAAKAKLEGQITVFGGDQWRPFIHVDDAALAVARILAAPTELVGGQIYNVGSNEQNFTIRQIGQIVHQCVPDAELIVNDDDVDKRNYRVDFSKIRNELNFTPQWTVEQGIQQVLDAIASGEVTDYREAQYSNVKFLTTGGSSRFARDTWARELINDITGQ
ncbi:MAG: SDR family oxidoreductase [Planctomycetota bacterium]|nr:SDR family oxidoreductase [Planctomycetota bacterium]